MEKSCKDIKQETKVQLNRIKGQINGIEKMINEERDSYDILIQISAIKAGLSKLAQVLLKLESQECFEIKDEKAKLKKFEELVSQFFKIN